MAKVNENDALSYIIAAKGLKIACTPLYSQCKRSNQYHQS